MHLRCCAGEEWWECHGWREKLMSVWKGHSNLKGLSISNMWWDAREKAIWRYCGFCQGLDTTPRESMTQGDKMTLFIAAIHSYLDRAFSATFYHHRHCLENCRNKWGITQAEDWWIREEIGNSVVTSRNWEVKYSKKWPGNLIWMDGDRLERDRRRWWKAATEKWQTPFKMGK